MSLPATDDLFGMEYGLALHARCLAGEVDAFDQLANLYFLPLFAQIRRSNPAWRDEDDFWHAAEESIMSYKKRPEIYNTKYGKNLFGFLVYAAEADFKNIIKSHQRHHRAQISLVVEDYDDGSEYELPIADGSNVEEQVLLSLSVVYRDIEETFDDPRDRVCAWYILERVRETEAYAAIYGLIDLPPKELEHEVKKHKDRVKKRLLRRLDRKDYLVHD